MIFFVFSPYPGPQTLTVHNLKSYTSLKYCLKNLCTLNPGYIATFLELDKTLKHFDNYTLVLCDAHVNLYVFINLSLLDFPF